MFALFIGGFCQAGNTLRLYYTDDVADEICYDINPSEYSAFDWSLGVSRWRRANKQPTRLVRMVNSHLGFQYVRAD